MTTIGQIIEILEAAGIDAETGYDGVSVAAFPEVHGRFRGTVYVLPEAHRLRDEEIPGARIEVRRKFSGAGKAKSTVRGALQAAGISTAG